MIGSRIWCAESVVVVPLFDSGLANKGCLTLGFRRILVNEEKLELVVAASSSSNAESVLKPRGFVPLAIKVLTPASKPRDGLDDLQLVLSLGLFSVNEVRLCF